MMASLETRPTRHLSFPHPCLVCRHRHRHQKQLKRCLKIDSQGNSNALYAIDLERYHYIFASHGQQMNSHG